MGRILFWLGAFTGITAAPLAQATPLAPAQQPARTVDYAIIGAGPAGYVVAERLSRDPNVNVTIFEAGPDASTNPLVEVPAEFFLDERYVWNYSSLPDPALGGLTPNLWQGRALGGGTAVNAMIYCRGSSSVFDEWAQVSGNPGLAWNSLLQDFSATTQYENQPTKYNQKVNASVLGNGPLAVSRARTLYSFEEPLASLFQSKLDLQEIDFIDGSGIGYSLGLETIIASNRTRSYAQNSYGYLFANRPNVHILDNAWVSRIGFSNTTAQSITYTDTTSDQTHRLNFKEIIVTAGAVNTPQLLMLSGVGPKAQLEPLNINVVADIPEIGSNLVDHHYSVVEYQATEEVDTVWQWDDNSTDESLAKAQYAHNGKGPLGENNGGVNAGQRLPDSVFEAVNSSYYLSLPKDRPQIAYTSATTPFLQSSPNVSIVAAFAAVVQPEAKGHMVLNSSDYREAPLIYSNYYGSDGDKAAIMYGYKELRSILQSGSLKPYLKEEIFPGPKVTTDEQIWQSIQQSAQSWHHPVGTTAIGTVLDSNWRIKGLQGIRVVGSSAMPFPPTCPIQAAVYALAHRAAQDIYEADASS